MAPLPGVGLTAPGGTSAKGRVLVVDDEEALLGLIRATLRDSGWDVECASNGREATGIVQRQKIDVIVTDISMPEVNGIEFLRTVRKFDLDVPVVLMTGVAELDTAIQAVELGAMRYLEKPVRLQHLVEVVEYGGRIHALAKVKREALAHLGATAREASDLAGLETRFRAAVDSLSMAYQPIVCFSKRGVDGYEALVRSKVDSLSDPASLFHAAEQLDLTQMLGRRIRERVATIIPRLASHQRMFVNLHPAAFEDDELYAATAPLSQHASRVVLEISERARFSATGTAIERIKALRAMGFRFALDDVGAGYAGLGCFLQLMPEIVKLDASLIRDIDRDPVKQKLVGSLHRLFTEIDVVVIAEGVETKEECETLVKLGADYLQGYFLARPGNSFPSVSQAAFAD